MNTTNYASNIVHRIYPAFWVRFCKLLDIDVRDYAVFKDGSLIGLSIPIPEEKTKEFHAEFEEKFFNLERISIETEPVRHYVVKQGSFFFDVYFFEKNISIEVNSATNPKLV
ncbi:hypothetical protein JA33_210 [Dickeya phage vB_DsoM_JA33]|uniref:Uncharacterized protein n=3 Tax=Salmondvirus JA11 TaxID=2734141 RepID=A0A384ZWJ6_9CAUD|nr:hypothetical protein HOU32_gp209 [Dickeya phage vB_DsoM_JA11]AXG66612.1 hypothetical protein JA13_209 [Dickeya phage vB_DsoM_JA13]AXG67584.1 hypothetical protein JA33_210 [Dickeya phage vB_DsoM_JA33]AYD80014.1 hypothetical protein JA11_209 [Dickeya phage vB_DsoM_JA11]